MSSKRCSAPITGTSGISYQSLPKCPCQSNHPRSLQERHGMFRVLLSSRRNLALTSMLTSLFLALSARSSSSTFPQPTHCSVANLVKVKCSTRRAMKMRQTKRVMNLMSLQFGACRYCCLPKAKARPKQPQLSPRLSRRRCRPRPLFLRTNLIYMSFMSLALRQHLSLLNNWLLCLLRSISLLLPLWSVLIAVLSSRSASPAPRKPTSASFVNNMVRSAWWHRISMTCCLSST
ncbi:hypothetical protein L218DRAFT_1080131, partial [Marasmius fiardii PR-910]